MAKRKTSGSEKKKRGPGRPRILLAEPERKKSILSVLRLGGSRTDAAVAADIDRTTLTEEARRDPKFQEEMCKAELAGKIIALRTVQGAINNNKDDPRTAFLAAKWFLGVKYWKEFAQRNPDAIKPEDVISLIQQLVEAILNELPPKFHVKVHSRVEDFVSALRKRR